MLGTTPNPIMNFLMQTASFAASEAAMYSDSVVESVTVFSLGHRHHLQGALPHRHTLRRTKEFFLVYGGEEELIVNGYTDAAFQTDVEDSKSQSGYVFCLNRGVVSWKSSEQDTVADSTIESQYIAASEGAKEAVWIRKFITGLGVVPSILDPIELHCDNNGAIAQAKEPLSRPISQEP